MRKKIRRHALYGIAAVIMAATAIGGVAAKETQPYKAPELRLVKGSQEYDLLEGITYNKSKYQLMVEDTGDFDIDVLGKYIVEYSLTPLEDGEEVTTPASGTGTTGGSHSSGSGGGASGGHTSAPSESNSNDTETKGEDPKADQEKETERETEAPDKDNTADEDHRQDENGGSDQDKNNGSENAGDDKGSENDKDTSNGSGKEDNSGAGPGDASGENKSDDQSENNSGSGSDTDQDASNSENAGDSNSGTGNDGSDADQNTSDEMMSVSSNNKKESLFVRLAAKFAGHVYAAETETKEVKEEESKKETKVEQTKETKETDIKETTAESQKTDQKENETTQETETADDPTAESTVPAETETETETAKAEETKESIDQTEEGKLDENDTVIYFNRIVRVVAAEGELAIEYDEPNLQIPSNADLFTLIEEKEVDLIEPEKDETGKQNEDIPHEETTNSQEKKEDTEKTGLLDKKKHVLFGEEKNTDTELEENQDAENSEEENAAEEIPETDVIQDEDMIQDTDEDMEYELVMKNPEMILDDVVLADAEGNKIRNAKITIKNDEELKDAVRVEVSANGVPYIAGIEEGIYTIEISAIDLETEEEIICERDIEVIPSEQIYFDAPDLYIGTKNTSYDLLAGMVATDEKGEEVKALYVINDQELAKVKINTEDEDAQEETATASNAETPTTHLKKGTYRVVIGAKHPVSGEEFTVTRKVYVIDGYYIYAPTLEIEAGSTFYNLLDGVELRNANDGSRKEDAKITVTDMTDLLRGSETEDEWFDEEDPVQEERIAETGFSAYSLEPTEITEAVAAEETTVDANVKESEHAESVNEETVNTGSEFMPPVKAGTYQVKLSATDPETGETITVFRTVKAKASAYVAVQADHEYAMTAELNAYKDRVPDLTTMDIDKIVGTVELNDMESGIGWYVSAAISGNNVIDLPVPSVPEGYDRKITYRQRDEAGFLVGGGVDIANITTYHYSDYKDRSLAGLLGFGMKDIYVATGRGTEWGKIDGHGGLETSVFRTGVMKQQAGEYISQLNNQTEVWDKYDTANYPLGSYNKWRGYQNIWNKDGKTTYTGYALTKAMKSNFNPEDGNIADLDHPFASADWANVGATDDTREKWDHDAMDTLFGYKKDEPKTMKDGFPADITITANKDLTNENLNFQTLYSTYHKIDVTKNMTKNSSVEVNGEGHNLTGSTITVNSLQVALNDFNNIENPFILRNLGYLRLKDIKGNNTINVSAYSDDEKKNGSLLDIAGGTTKPITVKNIPNVRITAGEQDMGPVRILGDYAETGDDAYAANHVLDTNGKTIYVYRVDTAGHTQGKTVLKGDGIIKMMDTQDGESNAQYGNMLRLKDVVLEGDVTIQKSAYAPNGDRKGATAMTINGQSGLTAYNHKIKLMASSAGLEDGEVLVGQGAGEGMDSSAILNVNDFELVSPKEGELYNGKYYYLSLENGGKTIVAKASVTKPIQVTPTLANSSSTDGSYSTYEQALLDILTYGTKVDYVITNKVEREFSAKAAEYLSQITSDNAKSLMFQSADRGKRDDQQGNRFVVKVIDQSLTMPRGVDVTFKNMALQYDDAKHNTLIFYANGSKLTFDEDCVFFGRVGINADKDILEYDHAKPTLYCGMEQGNSDLEANVTIKSGTFGAVYGGNKEGVHNAKTTINIIQTDENKTTIKSEEGLFIGLINGAGENETEKSPDKSVVINMTGPAFANTQQLDGDNSSNGFLNAIGANYLYNFDQLNVNGQVVLGKDFSTTTKESTEIDSGKIKGYKGEVIVGDGAVFCFADSNGYKKIGSLHRQKDADITKTTRVVLTRVSNYKDQNGATYDPKDYRNQYALTLTDTDPFGFGKGYQARLDFQYNTLFNQGLGEDNDVIIRCTGVLDADKSKYVRTSTIDSSFRVRDTSQTQGFKWVKTKANVNDKTIRIGTPTESVLLLKGDPVGGATTAVFTQSIFATVDEALKVLENYEYQNQGSKYIISIYRDGYRMDAVDLAEMDNPLLKTVDQIVWTSIYSPTATNLTMNSPVGFYVDGDWNFTAKKNILDRVLIKYSQKYNWYANGNELQSGYDVVSKNTTTSWRKSSQSVRFSVSKDSDYPDVYGGGLYSVDSTNLKISSGVFSNIYGGGYGTEGIVTGDTHVVMRSAFNDDVLEERNVYGGGNEAGTVKGKKNISIPELAYTGYVDTENKPLEVPSKVTLRNLKDFDVLTVGKDTAGRNMPYNAQLKISGDLISAKEGDDYVGTVKLYDANVYFTGRGTEGSHIKDFYSDGESNVLTIYRDSNGTCPLLLDGSMSNNGTPLNLAMQGKGAVHGDLMLRFKEESNAVEAHYECSVPRFYIVKDEGDIILEGDAVVLLIKNGDGDFNPEYYPSIQKTLIAIGTKEQAQEGGTYKISIFGSSYKFQEKDYKAMEATASSDTEATDPLSHVKTAENITWNSAYTVRYDDAQNKRTTVTTTAYNTVLVDDDLSFVGNNVTWEKIKLKYLKTANIYANGKKFLTDLDFEILSDNNLYFPNLYGGGKETVENTDITIKRGRFNNVYGGGYGKNGKVNGDTNIAFVGSNVELYVQNTIDGGGSDGAAVSSDTVKTIKMIPNVLEAGTVTYGLNWLHLTAGNVQNFNKLVLGHNKVLTSGMITNLTLKGKMQGATNYVNWIGDVELNNSRIYMTGESLNEDYSGYLRNLESTGEYNEIWVAKKNGTSRPFTFSGKVTLTDATKKLKLGVRTAQALGDKLFMFPDEQHAKSASYGCVHSGMMAMREKNYIILQVAARMHFDSATMSGNLQSLQGGDTQLNPNYNLTAYSKRKADGTIGTVQDWNNFGGNKDNFRPYRVGNHWYFGEGTADVRLTPITNDSPFHPYYFKLGELDTKENGNPYTSNTIQNMENGSMQVENPDDEYSLGTLDASTGVDFGAYQKIPANFQLIYKDLALENPRNVTHNQYGIRWSIRNNAYLRAEGVRKNTDRDPSMKNNFKTDGQPLLSIVGSGYGKGSTLDIVGYSEPGHDENLGVEVWSVDNIILRCVKGGSSLRTSMRLGGVINGTNHYATGKSGTNFIINPNGETIVISAISNYVESGSLSSFDNLYLDGGGYLVIDNDPPYHSNGAIQSIFVDNIYLDGDLTLIKNKNFAAIVIDKTIHPQGHKLIAGINKVDEPTDGEVFAKHRNKGVMNPNWFIVKREEADGTWGDMKHEWSITNGDTNDVVVFRKLKDAPLLLMKDDVEVGKYEKYEEAFLDLEKIDSSDTQVHKYTLINTVPIRMLSEEKKHLEELRLKDNTSLKITAWSDEEHKSDSGVGTFGHYYHITVECNDQQIDLPSNIHITFDTIMQFVDDGHEYTDATFVKNGGNITFTEHFQLVGDPDTKEHKKATVYGGSITKDKAPEGNAPSSILINGGDFASVYGGGSISKEGNTKVMIAGGTVDQVFGGGFGAEVTGDIKVVISGGEITEAVHGGGKNATVVGNTELEVSEIAVQSDKAVSYYGGGENGLVTGNTQINIQAINTAVNTNFYMGIVSAEGTDKNGRLIADSVRGTDRKIFISQKDPESAVVLQTGTISGFTELTLGATLRDANNGNAPSYDYNKFQVIVKDRFDSAPTGASGDITAKRSGNVKLYATMLTMDGSWQGHIGTLEATDGCAIKVGKPAGQTYPLIMDGKVKRSNAAHMIRLLNTSGVNVNKDRFLTFTTPSDAETDHFIDGTEDELMAMLQDENTVRHIILDIPKTHNFGYYITYAPEDSVTLEEEGKTNISKVIHFTYDLDAEEHKIKGGYIVEMPKSYVTNASISEDVRKTYTVISQDFIASDTLPSLRTGNVYRITFAADGKTAETNAINIQDGSDGYWYIAHFVCETGETKTMLLDVSAPVQDTTGVSTSVDTKTQKYNFVLTYKDGSETDDKVPRAYRRLSTGVEKAYPLVYQGNGVKQVYWSIGTDETGTGKLNVAADNAVAKRWDEILDDSLDENGTVIRGKGKIVGIDGSSIVSGGGIGKVELNIPRGIVETHKGDMLWVYVKDEMNNTRKYGIPLSENQIDVRVPLKVYLVALKKTTDTTPELLAPDCYVVNDGENTVKAQISGFETSATDISAKLRLSTKSDADRFDADEIALFVRKIKGSTLGSPLPEELLEENNVKSIDPNDNTTWLNLGQLGPRTSNERTKDFTFDAIYDPQKIVELGDGEWLENTMSYNFSIINQKP